jgi:hypothetical protein
VLENHTPHAVAHAVLTDPEGRELLVVAIKATYHWQRDGALKSAPPLAVHEVDVYAGPPASSGLLAAAELTLPKPRVDVLLEGEISLPKAVEQVDCILEVGRRLRKTVRVIGPRVWSAGVVRELVPSRARPFQRMPIGWERSFGGTDPDDPLCVESRNPSGCGFRKRPTSLPGQPAPNFEDPLALIAHAGSRPGPVGFGPVAPHWRPRRDFAGTYDEAWQQQRFPLLPTDFDVRFFNAAPADQQLEDYLPGEEIRLQNMSPALRDRFTLPDLAPPVSVVEGSTMFEVPTAVDTIVIAPAEQRLSVVARAVHPLTADAGTLAAVFVGAMTAGRRQALLTGKAYARSRR